MSKTTTPLGAIERHAETINARDLDAYRDTMHYPFTYQNYNGVALTIDNPQACGDTVAPPWEIILRTDPHWAESEFEVPVEVARSSSSVVYIVRFRRVDVGGMKSDSYQAIWIAVRKDDTWGIQFRHNLGRAT